MVLISLKYPEINKDIKVFIKYISLFELDGKKVVEKINITCENMIELRNIVVESKKK